MVADAFTANAFSGAWLVGAITIRQVLFLVAFHIISLHICGLPPHPGIDGQYIRFSHNDRLSVNVIPSPLHGPLTMTGFWPISFWGTSCRRISFM